jgi:SAM-dependent methyltransferase
MILRLKSILFSIQKRGIIDTSKMVIYELFFDLFNRVNTGGYEYLHNLNIKSHNIIYSSIYEPSNKLSLDKIFTFLDGYCNLKEKTLLDFGSGKGRVLIYFSKYKLKKLIGVEFASDLCEIAKNNIDKLKLKNIDIINQDVTRFIIPKDVNIFYFYNPFLGETFQKVLENIDIFHYHNPDKKSIIVYVIPVCKNMISLDKYNIIYEVDEEIVIFKRK